MSKMKNILLKYENKWVALTPDNKKVITSASDAWKLSDKLQKMKIAHGEAVMMFVRPFDAYYAPCLRKLK